MKNGLFAILSNLNGLSSQEKNKLLQSGCSVGAVYDVKEVKINDASYEVVCDVRGNNVTINGNNLEMYKSYDGNDIKHYNPMQNVSSQSQRGA